MSACGVDGVKIDNQSVLESLADGLGGRVGLCKSYRRAFEAAAQRHFAGTVMNCMCHGNEILQPEAQSALIRTSTDFWPNIPSSHGKHLWANALVSLWLGKFFRPDWDMFQSRHPRASFHAAGRALSGGPIYVSDKPGCHDFEVLRTLVLPNGKAPGFPGPPTPSGNSLFGSPGESPLIIWNEGPSVTAVGVFDLREPGSGEPKKIRVGRADVPRLPTARCATRLHRAGITNDPDDDFHVDLLLAAGEWEIILVAPVENGMAIFGPEDLLAGAATVDVRPGTSPDHLRVTSTAGGSIVGWSAEAPREVTDTGPSAPVPFTWDANTLRIRLPLDGVERHLSIHSQSV